MNLRAGATVIAGELASWLAARKGATVRPRRSSSAVAGGGLSDGAPRFARRAAIPMLADLTSLTDASGRSLDCTSLIDLVRRSSFPGSDVRVLADGADLHRETLHELAETLQCDVYLVGSDIELTDVEGEIVAFDRLTREPVPWSVIRPAGVGLDAPTWFEHAAGRIRVRDGLVTLPFSTGLAFASRTTFLDMIRCLAVTPVRPDDLTAVVVEVHSGCFRIAWYTGAGATLGGQEFARLVAASMDTIGSEVRVTLAWPAEEPERARLHEELELMAQSLDRTVWVPDPAGAGSTGRSAMITAVCADPSVRWVPYGRSPASGQPAAMNYPDSHRRVMRQADAAFRGLRFDIPAEAEQLRRTAEVWAAYLEEYERVAQAERAESDDIDDLDQLRQELGRLVDDLPPSDSDEGGPSEPPVRNDRADSDDLAVDPVPRSRAHHRVSWLPRLPMANGTPLTLYFWLPSPPDRLAAEGISVPDPFLLVHRNPEAVLRGATSGCLLRLEVPPWNAIRLSDHAGSLPAPLQRRAREAADVFLIPATWMPSVRVSEWCDIDRTGQLEARHPEQGRLLVSFRGADHGVPGLPNGAVRWPDRRGHATAVLTLPDHPEWIQTRLRAFPGWLPLLRRGSAPAGFRVLEVEVEHRAAIDVPATLAAFAQAPIAPHSVASLTGVDLALPAKHFGCTTITDVSEAIGRGRRVGRHELIGQPLTHALPGSVPYDMHVSHHV